MSDTEKLPSSDEEAEKADLPKASVLSLLWAEESFDWVYIFTGTLGGLITGFSIPAFNVLFGLMLDALNEDDDPDFQKQIEFIAVMFVIIASLNLFTGYFQVVGWSYFGELKTQRIREKYVHAILSQEIGWFDSCGANELSTRVADLAGKVQDGTGRKVGDLIQYTAQVLGSFIVGFYLNWRLTLVLLTAYPLIGAAGAFMINAVTDAKNKSMEQYAAAGGIATEALSSIRTVTALNIQPQIIAEYRKMIYDAMLVGITKGLKVGMGHGGVFCAAFLTYGLGFWYGAKLVADSLDDGCTDDCTTGGDILAVFFSVIMGSIAMGQMAPPISAIAEAQCAYAPMVALIERIPLIDSFSKEGDIPNRPSRGQIRLSNVNFAYPTRQNVNVCQDYNLTVEAGESIALVGVSGSGKSTIMNLLMRYYDPQQGEVKLDGKNVKEYNTRWLRSQFGYVGQEPVLFAGSIADNILDGFSGLDDVPADVKMQRMTEATIQANAHEFIVEFPQGYDTDVGSNGTQLSGGQKQRIAIARALIRRPAVLLLDEATSALDNTSERIVQASLDNLQKNKSQTIVIIAHRLSTIRNADKIAVVSNGKIVELGNHDTLFAKDGAYTDLVKLQMTGHEEDEADQEEVFQKKLRARSSSGEIVGATSSASGYAEVKTKDVDGKIEEDKDEAIEDGEKKQLNGKIWAMVTQHPFWLATGLFGSAVFGSIFPAWGLMLADTQNMFYLTDTDQMRREAEMQAIIYVVLAVLSISSCSLQYWGIAQVGEKVTMRLRSLMFESVLRREIAFFDKEENSVGSLTTQLSEDSRVVQKATSETLAKQVQSVFTLLIGIGLGFTACWQLAFVVLATFPVSIAASGIQMQAMAGQQYDSDNMNGGEGGLINMAFTHMKTIGSLSLQTKVSKLYASMTLTKCKLRMESAHMAGLGFGASQMVMFLTYALLFWYGGKLMEDEGISFQQVMQAIMVLMLGAVGLGSALADLTDQKEGILAARRIFSNVETGENSTIDSLSEKGTSNASSRGKVELKNVKFSYPSRPDAIICKGYSLTVEAGEVVALVGPSGSGKSTIMNLLLRFYDPLEGEVLFDGVDVSKLNVRWLRNQIGYIGQEPTLFSGTVSENIEKGRVQDSRIMTMEEAISKMDADMAGTSGIESPVEDIEMSASTVKGVKNDVVDVASTSNAHDFISSFPKGYQTDVGESSALVSGGQKQRIAIARALIRRPALLLMDEATSALDAESEKLIQDAIDGLQAARSQTTIIIAHRLSTIRNADKIAVLDQGQVVEMGTHDELLAKHGLYSKLWLKQTGSVV